MTGLWLNPCFYSPFRMPGICVPTIGRVAPVTVPTMTLKQLFSEAGERGIRVLLDLVPGHTSMEHPWFQASARAERNDFTDYYIWNNSIWEVPQNDLPIVRGLW